MPWLSGLSVGGGHGRCASRSRGEWRTRVYVSGRLFVRVRRSEHIQSNVSESNVMIRVQ